MANFLLGWELGGGLGHAARLKPLAEELHRRGHRCIFMLRDLVQTDNVLRGTPFLRLQAPVWLHQTMGGPATQVSLAEILTGNGYLQAAHLQAMAQGWLAAIELTQADAVIADYAPTAVLAARMAGRPSSGIGIGFYVPPDVAPVPAFRDWEPVPAARVLHADSAVLACANAVLAANGRPVFDRLAQLFRGDDPLLCTWPELDHYGRGELPAGQRYFGPNFLPHAGAAPEWPAGEGPKVFAYLKSAHPDHAEVLKALARIGCRVLCYLPEMAAGKPTPVTSPNIRYSLAPVDLGRAFAECQLVICHGGEATLAQALLAGVPLLLLPMQAEQFLISRCVARTGAGINAAEMRRPTDFEALIRRLIERPEARDAAAVIAQEHAGFDHDTQTREMADAFEALAARPRSDRPAVR